MGVFPERNQRSASRMNPYCSIPFSSSKSNPLAQPTICDSVKVLLRPHRVTKEGRRSRDGTNEMKRKIDVE